MKSKRKIRQFDFSNYLQPQLTTPCRQFLAIMGINCELTTARRFLLTIVGISC
jgi:hypothetical protein